MLVGMRRNKKREALPRDKTLWIASHRDSVISIANRITLSRERFESAKNILDFHMVRYDNEKNSIELLISSIRVENLTMSPKNAMVLLS